MPRQDAFVRGSDLPPRGGGGNPVMPTWANTGPAVDPTVEMDFATAVSAGGASNKVITGTSRIEDYSPGGETYTFTDCIFTQQLYLLFDDGSNQSGYSLANRPTVNLTRCHGTTSLIVIGHCALNIDYCGFNDGIGMMTPCPNCAGSSYSLEKAFPVVATNSYFRANQGVEHPTNPALNEHSEGIHIAGAGQGYDFYNCTMIQEGPLNNTQTAGLFFHGGASSFDWCWFHSNGTGDGAPFAIYSYGYGAGQSTNVFSNCRINLDEYQQAFYPITSEGFATNRIAVVTGCIDTATGNPIPQPTT